MRVQINYKKKKKTSKNTNIDSIPGLGAKIPPAMRCSQQQQQQQQKEMWKLNSMLLYNQWATEEIKEEI